MSTRREEDLIECPICWESFNIVENVPYVFWCGHTLCKTCVLSLRWAEVKLPTIPIQLPFFVSCPWCQLLSLRLVWKGRISFPRKNFLLLWLVETANGNRTRDCTSSSFSSSEPVLRPIVSLSTIPLSRETHNESVESTTSRHGVNHLVSGWRVWTVLRKSVALLLHLTAKFPVVVIFMLIVFYVIPTSAAILVMYLLITFLFALPSFMVLYFSYPILGWLARESAVTWGKREFSPTSATKLKRIRFIREYWSSDVNSSHRTKWLDQGLVGPILMRPDSGKSPGPDHRNMFPETG